MHIYIYIHVYLHTYINACMQGWKISRFTSPNANYFWGKCDSLKPTDSQYFWVTANHFWPIANHFS